MTEPLLILLTTLFTAAIVVGLGMMAWYLILRQLRKETGPWVVTRVASDGSGGVEFWQVKSDMSDWWIKNVDKAFHFGNLTYAQEIARDYLADVHPLSRYVGGVR